MSTNNVYFIESTQQLWSELEDTMRLHEAVTLSMLDATFRRFMALCATYHEEYLQSPLQLENACKLLLTSEFFEFHSERMLDIIFDDARTATNPHSAYIYYTILFYHGQNRVELFRSHSRWRAVFPIIMDYVVVELPPDIEDSYIHTVGGKSSNFSAFPVEAKLRSLGIKILYDICRVKALSAQYLKMFDEYFLNYLFDLVEQTNYMHDDTFNYSVIRLILALNEQFMLSGLQETAANSKNRVVHVMILRQGECQTFGENLILMLNRTKDTTFGDICVNRILILKMLYVLFSTEETSEFFPIHDLCVLVHVFLWELGLADEKYEVLRDTYLRVLHVMLTKTKLREVEYKRPQIFVALQSIIINSSNRVVSPTTRRLVERCLSGEWSASIRETRRAAGRPPLTDVLSSTVVLSPNPQAGSSMSIRPMSMPPDRPSTPSSIASVPTIYSVAASSVVTDYGVFYTSRGYGSTDSLNGTY